MNNREKKLLQAQPLDSHTDVSQTIREFIKIFNAGSSDPYNYPSEKWKISNNEWQRYEFLGDRVLNLVVAEYLYYLPPQILKRRTVRGG